jgi:hypothetical protein
MIALSMESIFLILSGVILLAGILYWFWSHIQLTQKKVQLLENAIYELRDMVTQGGGGGPRPSSQQTVATPAPSMYNDLADDDWEESADVKVISTGTPVSSSVPETEPVTISREEEFSEDTPLPLSTSFEAANEGDFVNIQRVEYTPDVTIHDVVYEMKEDASSSVTEQKDFRDIFITTGSSDDTGSASAPQHLESMPVKELRRLAEQRGIDGAHDMRKKELLSALRSAVAPQASVGTTVTIEKYLNLDVTEETAEVVDTEILE